MWEQGYHTATIRCPCLNGNELMVRGIEIEATAAGPRLHGMLTIS